MIEIYVCIKILKWYLVLLLVYDNKCVIFKSDKSKNFCK